MLLLNIVAVIFVGKIMLKNRAFLFDFSLQTLARAEHKKTSFF